MEVLLSPHLVVKDGVIRTQLSREEVALEVRFIFLEPILIIAE